jgi:hypothetical protein
MDPVTAGIMVGGALLGGMSGRKGSTATQQQQLPDFLQPYAPYYAQAGAELASMPYQPYPYQRVAPFSQDQLSGMDAARNVAGQQSPLFGQAGGTANSLMQGSTGAQMGTLANFMGGYSGMNDPSAQFMSQTMGGQFLNNNQPYSQRLDATSRGDYLDPASNPYLQQTYDLAANRMADAYAKGTGASTNAAFGKALSFGGSAHQEVTEGNNRAFGDSLGNLANQVFGGNFQAERARQMQATGMLGQDFQTERARQMAAAGSDLAQQMQGAQAYGNFYDANQARRLQAAQLAPNIANMEQQYGLNSANALMGIGGMQQNLGQQYMNADYQQFMDARNYPYQQFDVFGSLFNPNLGRTSTTMQPGVGAVQGGLSGLLGGYALNQMFNQPQQNAGGTGYFGGIRA